VASEADLEPPPRNGEPDDGVGEEEVDDGEDEQPAALPLVVYARRFLACLTAICKTVRGGPFACSAAMATRRGASLLYAISVQIQCPALSSYVPTVAN
jgi:hypothetical protein